MVIFNNPTKIVDDKPIQIGFSILEFAKQHMQVLFKIQ